jgi:predicted cupin superfamily sugar epimerase
MEQPWKVRVLKKLELSPLPGEGGFYRETWRSELSVETSVGLRAAGTAIYFFLTAQDQSGRHRLKFDEVWHFYEGTPVGISWETLGVTKSARLGGRPDDGEVRQVVIPAGAWMEARCVGLGPYALMGCTMAPGFEFQDVFTHLGQDEARFW